MGARIRRAFWTLHSLTWDGALTREERTRRAREVIRWVEGRCCRRGRLVDLGCGTGVHAWALQEAGYQVTGLDFSAGMLRRAAAKKSSRGTPAPVFRQADLDRELPLANGAFDTALCWSVLQ